MNFGTKSKEMCMQEIMSSKIRWIDLQFTGIDGKFHHVTIPSRLVSNSFFEEGIGKLDGSSINGFTSISDSDMVLKPVVESFSVLPWYSGEDRTARFISNIYQNGKRFARDSRYISEKAEEYAKDIGYSKSYWGPELEFFVFDKVDLSPSPASVASAGSMYGVAIHSEEAPWNSEHKYWFNRIKGGYYSTPPEDSLVEYRNHVSRIIEDNFGIQVEAHHHEVATGGQCEINIHYNTLTQTGDNISTIKYVTRMVASQMNKIATFMPKPVYGDNASGLHIHQSLWRDNRNIFFDDSDEYAQISQECRYYIGGLIYHARSLCAFTNPSTNSYRRLVPGYEAPIFIAWSRGNRSANIRIPRYVRGSEASTRVEYRTPDTSANIYMCQAAILLAGLDGIKHKIEPNSHIDEDIYELDPEKRKALGIKELPGSLKEAIEELGSDSEYLTYAFDSEFLEHYKEMKLKEHIENSLRPTPYEFYQYFDI